MTMFMEKKQYKKDSSRLKKSWNTRIEIILKNDHFKNRDIFKTEQQQQKP